MGRYAGKGLVWVCLACGKVSPHDKYGNMGSDMGWDESCVLNSVLVKKENIIRDEKGNITEVVEVEKENKQ